MVESLIIPIAIAILGQVLGTVVNVTGIGSDLTDTSLTTLVTNVNTLSESVISKYGSGTKVGNILASNMADLVNRYAVCVASPEQVTAAGKDSSGNTECNFYCYGQLVSPDGNELSRSEDTLEKYNGKGPYKASFKKPSADVNYFEVEPAIKDGKQQTSLVIGGISVKINAQYIADNQTYNVFHCIKKNRGDVLGVMAMAIVDD